MMTPACLSILQAMADAQRRLDAEEPTEPEEESELVCEGIYCYLGTRRVHRKTVRALLDATAISDVSDSGEGLQRFAINSTGEAILRRPELAHEVWAHIYGQKGSFTIKNDRIVLLD
jgi:hypothetical protein